MSRLTDLEARLERYREQLNKILPDHVRRLDDLTRRLGENARRFEDNKERVNWVLAAHDKRLKAQDQKLDELTDRLSDERFDGLELQRHGHGRCPYRGVSCLDGQHRPGGKGSECMPEDCRLVVVKVDCGFTDVQRREHECSPSISGPGAATPVTVHLILGDAPGAGHSPSPASGAPTAQAIGEAVLAALRGYEAEKGERS